MIYLETCSDPAHQSLQRMYWNCVKTQNKNEIWTTYKVELQNQIVQPHFQNQYYMRQLITKILLAKQQ